MKISIFYKARLTKSILLFILTTTTISCTNPRQEHKNNNFFNGNDLSGWSSSNMNYWKVEDGAIVGHSATDLERSEYIWSDVEVKDFYLSVDILQEPEDRNAGIQFRSRKIDASGEPQGYQADVGMGGWGRLYHENGRKYLDWTERGLKAAKYGEWNHYEILAVGNHIWTAINGTLATAVKDPEGELAGYIAFQMHAGDGQKVRYRVNKLVHNPGVQLAGLNRAQLEKELKPILKPGDIGYPE